MRYRIQLLAVSDAGVYQIGYVQRADEGDVYVNFTIDKSGTHISRHQRGATHTKHKRKKILPGAHTRQHLDAATFIIEQVATTAVVIDFLPCFRPYKHHRPSDEVFAVDLRQLPPGTPNIGIWLVSSQHFQYALDTATHLDVKQFYVYRYVEPWLMLAAFASPG